MSSLLQCVREMEADGHDFRTSGLAVAKRAVELLQAQGLHAAIAGGYVRDLVHGVEPKDIDVVCSLDGGADDKEYYGELVRLVSQFRMLYPSLVYVTYESYLETIEGDDRLSCVLKIAGCDKDIDVIFYQCTDNGIPGILDQFDCNLNQYALVDGEPKFFGEQVPPQGLVFLRDCYLERELKMTKKWEEFYGQGN